MDYGARAHRNIKLTIAYDGTKFSGFQRQAQGERTVQGIMEKTIHRLTGESGTLKLTPAGRTDAGVHALGQVVNFFTGSRIPIERWMDAMNSNLPSDVAVLGVEEAPGNFHARYSALKKTYQYRIYRSKQRNVFLRNYTYHYPYPLNINLMKEAAYFLRGEHDFKAFAASGSSVKTTNRNLLRLKIEEVKEELLITVEADGFLYKMVRNIVGTLLLVGESRMAPTQIKEILKGGRREAAGPTAPPHGLFLVKVEY